MNQKSNKGIIIFLCIIILILAGALVYFVCFNKDKEPAKPAPANEPTEPEKPTEPTEPSEPEKPSETPSKFTYEVKEEKLYVNGKKIESIIGNFPEDRIHDLGDVLLVGECRDFCDWYFFDENAKIVGTIGQVGDTINAKKVVVDTVIDPKFDINDVYEVDGKVIKLYTRNYTGQDNTDVCNKGKDEVIALDVEYTYQGNLKFSEPKTIETVKAGDLIGEDKKFQCE